MRCPFTKRCHPIDNAKTALTHCIDNAISAQSPKLPMHWQRPRFEILPLTLRCLRSHLDVTAFVSKLASHFQCKGSAKQTRVKHETLASLALSMQKLRVLHWTRVSSLMGKASDTATDQHHNDEEYPHDSVNISASSQGGSSSNFRK